MRKYTCGGSVGYEFFRTILNYSLLRKANFLIYLIFWRITSTMITNWTLWRERYRTSSPIFCLASLRFYTSNYFDAYLWLLCSLGTGWEISIAIFTLSSFINYVWLFELIRSYKKRQVSFILSMIIQKKSNRNIINSCMQNNLLPLQKLFNNLTPFLTNEAPFKENW